MKSFVNDILRIYNLEDKYMEFLAIKKVKDRLNISENIIDMKLNSGVLFIKINSPALKNDLKLKTEEIRLAVNSEIGKDVITMIAIL